MNWIRLALVCGLLGIAGSLQAQSLPTSYQAAFYNAGAAQPLQQSDTFLRTAASCNQTAPTTVSTVNPTRVVWNDEANPGKVCVFAFPSSAALFSLPIPGSYEATLKAVNAAGASAESNRAPFSRLAPSAVPTGLQFIQ